MTNNTPNYEDNLYFPEQKSNSDLIEQLKAAQKEIQKKAYDLGNLGYRIKNQRKEIEKQTKQNAELKELLKECFEYIDWTDGTGSPINQQKLLDKINEVLK